MTTTPYTRHVSDYSISAHEAFNNLKNGYSSNTPSATYISYVNNLSDETRDTVINRIVAACTDKFNLEQNLKQIMLYDDGETKRSEYTVFKQTVFGFGANENSLVLEFYERVNQVAMIVMCDNSEIIGGIKQIVDELRADYPEKQKEKTFYTIGRNQGGFTLEELTIKTHLETTVIDTNYNDDFKEVHGTIHEHISKDDNGLVLLHGEPGTGKTTYIKYLIGAGYERRVVYIPPHLAQSIADPDFVSFVREELSNCVLLIEDAETILRSRKSEMVNVSAVSNLLNISDGIIGDALNILIICTFNQEEDFLDDALLRKGRLKVKYKFSKLNANKANALLRRLGKDVAVNEDTTVANIYGIEVTPDMSPAKPKTSFGFAPATK